MRAAIRLDVPDWQIGQPVTVYFKDTMMKHGICEREHELVRCKECKHGRSYEPNCIDCEYMELARDADWYCADGERRTDDA